MLNADKTTESITWTCPVHGTFADDLEDDHAGPRGDYRPCCSRAWLAALKWHNLVDRALSCKAQDVQNKKWSDAGEWAGPAYVPCTPEQLIGWALSEIADDDAEFDYGFNVLYKEQLEAC